MISRRVRLRVWAAALAVALVGAAVAVALLVPVGAATRRAQPYAASRTVESRTLDRCIEVSVRGTLVGTRSERFGAVQWSGVRVQDPTIIAEGFMLEHGRCDRSRPWRMRADLVQAWTSGGAAIGTRSSDQGPAGGPLQQFNSGDPVDVPDTLHLRVPGTRPTLRVQAVMTVQAHSPQTEDDVHLPVEVALR